MAYEILKSGPDPIDIACSDCEVQEINWWEPISEAELHRMHAIAIEDDKHYPDFAKIADEQITGEPWKPTPENFDEFIAEMITDGWIRAV